MSAIVTLARVPMVRAQYSWEWQRLYAESIDASAQQKLQYEKEQVQRVTATQGAAGQHQTDVQSLHGSTAILHACQLHSCTSQYRAAKHSIVLGAVMHYWCQMDCTCAAYTLCVAGMSMSSLMETCTTYDFLSQLLAAKVLYRKLRSNRAVR